MQTNATKYASPEDYYEITKNRPLSLLLLEALELTGSGKNKTALDLGCGAGGETKYLLEKGFAVTAVEVNPAAERFLQALPHQDKLQIEITDMENFDFSNQYDLIVALRSLPFSHKESFKSLFAKIKASLKTNGIFVGNFFGINDQWNKKDETMSFHTKQDVMELLNGLKIVRFDEFEGEGKLANGKPKYWHTIDVIATKNR